MLTCNESKVMYPEEVLRKWLVIRLSNQNDVRTKLLSGIVFNRHLPCLAQKNHCQHPVMSEVIAPPTLVSIMRGLI